MLVQATPGTHRDRLGKHENSLPDEELKKQLEVCWHSFMPIIWTLAVSDLMWKSKSLWASIPLYNASLRCTKFSILFQYLRIFPGQWFRVVCYIVMVIVASYSTWAVVSGYVNCVPVAKFWDRKLPGNCLSFKAVWLFNASMNIATDVALLILPMPLLSQLQVPRTQKVALMAVFTIGIL